MSPRMEILKCPKVFKSVALEFTYCTFHLCVALAMRAGEL